MTVQTRIPGWMSALACVVAASFMICGDALAQRAFDVCVDTSALKSAGGRYFVLFVLYNPRQDVHNANNVTVRGFTFGGGMGGPEAPEYTGRVSGDLRDVDDVVKLSSATFRSTFKQAFEPGTEIGFQVFATTHVSIYANDSFAFYILDGNGNNIPTVGGSDGLFGFALSTRHNLYEAPHTDPARTTINLAPVASPISLADTNGDAKIDLADVRTTINCMSGPKSPVAHASCETGDLDGDVDLYDFGILQREFTGPAAPGLPQCTAPVVSSEERGKPSGR